MSAGHTPGPWEAVDGTTSGAAVIASSQPKVRRNVAACGGPNRDANARLIAAAPELLEALEQCRAYFASLSSMTVEDAQDAMTVVTAAIAKARAAA